MILDRGDELTGAVLRESAPDYQLIRSDHGDPGLARNEAVRAASGTFVTFLDGDDLWSGNWLVNGYEFLRGCRRTTVGHSECSIFFGSEPTIWLHADSEAEGFDPAYLRLDNYWDAMGFGERRVYLEFPFEANDLAAGYGHEDWLWSCVTLDAGVSHRPVPGTVHAKRRRPGSQSAKCADSDVIIRPNPLLKYAWPGPRGDPALAADADGTRQHQVSKNAG